MYLDIKERAFHAKVRGSQAQQYHDTSAHVSLFPATYSTVMVMSRTPSWPTMGKARLVLYKRQRRAAMSVVSVFQAFDGAQGILSAHLND